jgi:transcriptional regulator with XRE-family HTH domain
MEKYLREFANRLKMLREERGMSLRDLEEATGISKTALGYYENCERDPSLTVVKKLAEYFGESIDFLVGDTNIRNIKKIAK